MHGSMAILAGSWLPSAVVYRDNPPNAVVTLARPQHTIYRATKGETALNWSILALLSALFAGITAVLAKLGTANVNSNLATFIRTGVVMVFAFGIVAAQGQLKHIGTLSSKNWTFLILSGIGTGLSWLFYFAALKAGPVSHVAPIDKLSFVIAMVLGLLILNEKVTRLTWAGAALILMGALLTLPGVQQTVHKLFGK
jgi:bacterial/archaeal transporter family protein